MLVSRQMVLDAGNLVSAAYLRRQTETYSRPQVEFATPVKLLQTEGGYFRGLVDGSGDRATLHRMAGVDSLPSE